MLLNLLVDSDGVGLGVDVDRHRFAQRRFQLHHREPRHVQFREQGALQVGTGVAQ